jgi:hypothetical protein
MKKPYLIILVFISFIAISSAFTYYDPPGFKNLKILPKNITEKALDSIMDNFSISLGVKCGFCHVHDEEKDTWNMASDAMAEKLIARKMMIMTNGINAKYFPSEKEKKHTAAIQTVTCYTCHKGEAIPVSVENLEKNSFSLKIPY